MRNKKTTIFDILDIDITTKCHLTVIIVYCLTGTVKLGAQTDGDVDPGETHGGRWDHAGGGGASRNSREGRGIESERDGILELGIDDINRWLLNIMIETEMR